jgi:WS/DGAT/MGAT family acyltransferase
VAVPVAFERRMSDAEALMWALDLDPVLRSSFSNITFLDRPIDAARFRERMGVAVAGIPRLRQRVADHGSALAAPEWVDDPLFDLDYHLRTVAAPAPGDVRAVLDLAAVLSADPFDRARPLWQFTIVEGMADGRGALLQRLHHTITDGEAGIRLSASFVDLERDATEPMLPTVVEAAAEPRSLGDAVAARVRFPLQVVRSALGHTVDALAHPDRAPERAGEAVETARSLLRQVAVTEPARSPLWRQRSLRRTIEVLSVPLAEVKDAAGRLGGTVNDWFVTGAAGAAGAYHRLAGAPVDELRMAMPVSTRSADKAGGTNSFVPTRVLVPAGIEDPVARFDAVRSVLLAGKSERALGAVDGVAGVLHALPTSILARFARNQAGRVDFTTSNVRGAPFPLFIAGARIEGNHPVGPLAGTPFNLTTMSCNGQLDMGCVIDPAAVEDPALLRRCLVDAFDELRTVRR